MSELNPYKCPFCDEDHEFSFVRVHDNATGFHWVECDLCLASGPDGDDDEDAIAKWNKALGKLTAAREERDEMKEEVRRLDCELSLLANQMIYRGNSVAYIYQKKDAYKHCIGKVNNALNEFMDGETPNWEAAKKLRQDRDRWKAHAERLEFVLMRSVVRDDEGQKTLDELKQLLYDHEQMKGE